MDVTQLPKRCAWCDGRVRPRDVSVRRAAEVYHAACWPEYLLKVEEEEAAVLRLTPDHREDEHDV